MKLSLPISLTLISISALFLQGCSTNYSKPDSAKGIEVEYDAYYGQPERNSQGSYKPTTARLVEGSVAHHKGPQLRSNAPERYVVKHGDTLWDISKLFLKDPLYWPEIWDKNQKVRNPHRIFPGDVLYLHYKGSVTSGGGDTAKLMPTIRVERIGTGQPISTLAPFLAWPRVVSKDDISSAPYIVAARGANLIMDNDKRVYIKGLSHTQRGDSYGIYHTGKELRDPDTDELLGTEISYHGQVSVVHPDSVTTATIEKSNREIRAGDRVIKVDPKPRSTHMPIVAPNIKIRGSVMSIYDGNLIAGQHMIAVINRGQRDGIRPGHIVGVYSPPQFATDPYEKRLGQFHSKQPVSVKLPPERVGSMVVYDVSERFSYALITKANHKITKGCKIGNP